MTTRTRMSVEDRRRQLLEIGAELFAADPGGEVSVDAVIEKAGVSRALFYHYFSGKRDFKIESLRFAAERIIVATEPRPELPMKARLTAAIDGYLDVAENESVSYRAFYRGAVLGDPDIRVIREKNFERQMERMLNVAAPHGEGGELLRIALHAWLWFTIHATLEWLDSGEPSRDELRDLLVEVCLATGTAATSARADGASAERL